jgi:hypothetical protein
LCPTKHNTQSESGRKRRNTPRNEHTRPTLLPRRNSAVGRRSMRASPRKHGDSSGRLAYNPGPHNTKAPPALLRNALCAFPWRLRSVLSE